MRPLAAAAADPAAAGADLAALQAALQAAGANPAALQAALQAVAADPAAAAAAAAAALRATVAAGNRPAAAADPAWTGLGMAPEDAPLVAAALRGQQADATLAAALLAARSCSPSAAMPSTTRLSRRGTWLGCASTESPCPGSSGPSP